MNKSLRKKLILLGIMLTIVVCIVNPFYVISNSFYYTALHVPVLQRIGGYWFSRSIGENGSIFFIKLGLHSSDIKKVKLFIDVSVDYYCQNHSMTDELNSVIADAFIAQMNENGLHPRGEGCYGDIVSYFIGRIYYNVVPISPDLINKHIYIYRNILSPQYQRLARRIFREDKRLSARALFFIDEVEKYNEDDL